MPYPSTVVRNRGRSCLGLLAFVGFLALTVWAAASSPLDATDVVLDVCFFLPILVLLFRFSAECVLANPMKDGIHIHNLFRSWNVAWDDIDRFEVTDQKVGTVIPTQVVNCVLKDARRIRVRGAGRWVRQAGDATVSLTGRKTLGLISQELNIRRHQHEFGLPVDQLPQPW
jgi:hypothetical protein